METRSKKFDQQIRFRLIELLLLWEGGFNRKRLCETFHLAANYVTTIVSEYEKACPRNIRYDQRGKRYIPSEAFKAKFCSGTTNEYLELLEQQQADSRNPAISLSAMSACHIAPTPTQALPVKVLRDSTTAITEQRKLKINYQSLTAPDPAQRTISPHALVKVAHRWHLRAFDHGAKGYRDFVLHRIKASNLGGVSDKGAKEDTDWVAVSTLKITPNPLASDTQKQAIAAEYGMKPCKTLGYVWEVETKNCLVSYLIEAYNLNRNVAEPRKSPIVLANSDQLAPLFFKE